jgi:hypothetical protein
MENPSFTVNCFKVGNAFGSLKSEVFISYFTFILHTSYFEIGGRNMSVASIPSIPNATSVVSIESIESVERLDTNYVMSQEITNASRYSLIFDKSDLTGSVRDGIIPVKSRREVELLLLSLGKEASVIMDESARMQYPDVWDWLYGRTYDEVFSDLKWSYREEDEVLDIIERIPLPRTLRDSFIKMNHDDPDPERINQELVHKIHQENVLISKPFQCGNMFYFNGFNASSEINIDHHTDHLEGIIIFEAARQAGIASARLAGMPLSGVLVILRTTTKYSKFVECCEPYLIRTIPVYKQRGGVGYCIYNVIQKGKSCATGYFTAIAYNTKHMYEKLRNSKLVESASNEKIVDTGRTYIRN